jgi:PPOX class probable FMN-dependent enzyme
MTMTDHLARLRHYQVRTNDQIVALLGVASPAIAADHATALSPLAIEYIAHSPFLLIATANAAGECDVSPKGDAPGFVRVLDERTIVIPDRLGNKRADGHRNILANGHIGLLFMIPNVDETLRLKGRCFITVEPELLASMALQEREPKLAIVVEIEEVFMHCARSFLRSGLWKPETWPDADTVPTMRAINCDLRHEPLPDETGGKRNEEYRQRLT